MTNSFKLSLLTIGMLLVPATSYGMGGFRLRDARMILGMASLLELGKELKEYVYTPESTVPASTKNFVHSTLLEHGVDSESALKIAVVDREHAGSHRHTMYVPSAQIEAVLKDNTSESKQKSLALKGTIMHEYGHLCQKHTLQGKGLFFACVWWICKGSYPAIIAKSATSYIVSRAHSTACEYLADQEVIKRCDASILKAEAREMRKIYTATEQPFVEIITDTDNLLYKNIIIALMAGYPSALTRANYFEQAALKKEQKKAERN